MEPLLIVSAIVGLFCAGAVAADWLSRLRTAAELRLLASDWRRTLEELQAVHNAQTLALQAVSDRQAAVEMALHGVKR